MKRAVLAAVVILAGMLVGISAVLLLSYQRPSGPAAAAAPPAAATATPVVPTDPAAGTAASGTETPDAAEADTLAPADARPVAIDPFKLIGAASGTELAVGAVPSGDASAPAKSRLILSGRVTLHTGDPAAGAKVHAESPRNMPIPSGPGNVDLEATAGEDGTYTLEMDDTATLLLTASLEGLGREGRVLYDEQFWQFQGPGSPARTRKVTQHFVLGEPAAFAGIVSDPSDAPIAGAKLLATRRGDSGMPVHFQMTLNLAARFEAISGEDGAFSIEGAPAGEYLLMVTAKDYVALKTDVTVPDGALSLTLDQHGAGVSGVVFRKETGEPVDGAQVTLMPAGTADMRVLDREFRPQPVRTGATGEFRFEKLPAGRYSLIASKEKLKLWREEGTEPTFELAGGQVLAGQDVLLYGGSAVRGTVYDQATRQPLAGVTVDNNPWGHSGQQNVISDVTDENGVFYLSGVFGNRVELRAVKEGYTMVRPQQYQRGVQVEIDPELGEGTVDIDMVASLVVSGLVRRADGIAVTSGTAKWTTSNGGTEESMPLDSGGGFRFEVPPRTSGAVLAQLPGFHEASSGLVDVLESDVNDVEVVVEAPGALMGRVVDPDGRPVEGAEVQLYYLAQIGPNAWRHARTGESPDNPRSPGTALSAASGAFSFTKVAPTELYLTARKEGYSDSERKLVLVQPGETKTQVEVRLQRAHFLRGTVVDKDDNPVPRAQMHVNNNTGFHLPQPSMTDEQGRFALESLPDGVINISINHQSAGSKYFTNEPVDREDVVFKLDQPAPGRPSDEVQRAMMVGSVVDDATGAPVEGIRVDIDPRYGSHYRVILDREVEGLFRIDNMYPRSQLRFTISAPEYAPLLVAEYRVPADQPVVRETFRMKKGGRIIGRTVGAEGQPLAGVEIANKGVFLESWQEPQQPLSVATSGEDGRFEFTNVMEGSNTLRFLPRGGLAELRRDVAVTDGQTADMGDVTIDAGRRVRVQVVRMPGRTPMPGQVVRLRKSQTGTQIETKATGPDGTAVFEGLSNEDHSIELVEHQLRCAVRNSDAKEVSVALPLGSGTLKGLVTEGGKPLVSEVHLYTGWEGTTISVSFGLRSGTDGIFTREGLVGGKWNVTINTQVQQNYRHLQEQVDVADTGVTEHEFAFASGVLAGRVLDAAGVPVEGAVVRWERVSGAVPGVSTTPAQLTTSGDGTFRFTPMNEGVYNLAAEAPGRGRGKAEGISVPKTGEGAPAVITLVRTGGGTLISTAYDYKTGEGIPAAWCNLVNVDSGEAFTHLAPRGVDGIMRIDDIPAGTYTAEVSAWGYSLGTHRVVMAEGGIEEINDVLYEAGALRWTVRDAEGRPLTGVACTLTPNDPASIETVRRGMSDGNGVFVVRGLWPGMYTARAEAGAGRTLVKEVQIQAHVLTSEESRAEP